MAAQPSPFMRLNRRDERAGLVVIGHTKRGDAFNRRGDGGKREEETKSLFGEIEIVGVKRLMDLLLPVLVIPCDALRFPTTDPVAGERQQLQPQ